MGVGCQNFFVHYGSIWTQVLNFFLLYMDPLTNGRGLWSELRVTPLPYGPSLHGPSGHFVGPHGCSRIPRIVTKSFVGDTRVLEKVEPSKNFSRSMPTLKRHTPHRQRPWAPGKP